MLTPVATGKSGILPTRICRINFHETAPSAPPKQGVSISLSRQPRANEIKRWMRANWFWKVAAPAS
jgi:hypothetical protein